MKNAKLDFNIAPEKWWLEDYFPIGKVTFQGRAVKLREGNRHHPKVQVGCRFNPNILRKFGERNPTTKPHDRCRYIKNIYDIGILLSIYQTILEYDPP